MKRSPFKLPPAAALAIFNFNGITGAINDGPGVGIQSLAERILHILLAVAYPLAFIAILYSSYQLITSAGKPEPYAKAKANLINLFIGIFLIIIAGSIVRFFITLFGQ